MLGIDPDPAEDSWALDVEVIVEDYDLTSGADRMGSFTMTLSPHETAGGAWKALEDADGRVVKETKKEVQGDLLLVMRWIYDWRADQE